MPMLQRNRVLSRGSFPIVRKLQRIQADDPTEVRRFIGSLLDINVDARIFEIASYAILRPYYNNQRIYWGWEEDENSGRGVNLIQDWAH